MLVARAATRAASLWALQLVTDESEACSTMSPPIIAVYWGSSMCARTGEEREGYSRVYGRSLTTAVCAMLA